MAKPSTTAAPAAPTSPIAISVLGAPPATARTVGRSESDDPIAQTVTFMGGQAAPKEEKDAYGFFQPATVAEGIVDAGERDKAAKDSARKLSNKISGIFRRVKVQLKAPHLNLVQRTIKHKPEGQDAEVLGVAVYRLPDLTAEQIAANDAASAERKAARAANAAPAPTPAPVPAGQVAPPAA